MPQYPTGPQQFFGPRAVVLARFGHPRVARVASDSVYSYLLSPAFKPITVISSVVNNHQAIGILLKTIWIALFRGINVGGKNKMQMAPLKAAMESIGCQNVQTYIQSGNVVFESSLKIRKSLQAKILDTAEDKFGFRSQLILLTKSDLLKAIDSNPFKDATADPKSLHFFFLHGSPSEPDLDAIERLRADTESCLLMDAVFYLHAPAGISRSKVAASAERHLGVVVTARNFNTVQKLSEMLHIR